MLSMRTRQHFARFLKNKVLGQPPIPDGAKRKPSAKRTALSPRGRSHPWSPPPPGPHPCSSRSARGTSCRGHLYFLPHSKVDSKKSYHDSYMLGRRLALSRLHQSRLRQSHTITFSHSDFSPRPFEGSKVPFILNQVQPIQTQNVNELQAVSP